MKIIVPFIVLEKFKVNKMKSIILFLVIFFSIEQLCAQTYTSYFVGNFSDADVLAQGGICLMGGGSENDEAIKWFLTRANGGDILVLRASGSDAYNQYFYTELGIGVNSVESIVFHDPAASFDSYIHERISKAEAIWFAGGNQWDYVSYWQDTPIETLIREAIETRDICLGGTSAGMAILGGIYFTAQYGTILSDAALQNPFNENITLDTSLFVSREILNNTITDTHFDNPDRKGRLITFMARAFLDYEITPFAIACDEYTAVCIESDGIASVYGEHPDYDDNAYFIQTNCELSDWMPELCNPNQALTWSHDGLALKVYQVKGKIDGSGKFNLNTWQSGTGGSWNNWSVINGILYEETGDSINCSLNVAETPANTNRVNYYPNPFKDEIRFDLPANQDDLIIRLFDAQGRLIESIEPNSNSARLQTQALRPGIYFIQIKRNREVQNRKILKLP